MTLMRMEDMQPGPPLDIYTEPKHLKIGKVQKFKTIDVGACFSRFKLTRELVKEMSEAEFIYKNLIVKGHVALYAAPANGGKSAIFRFVCEKISKDYQVFYINIDASQSDLKKHFYHSEEFNYQVIAPDAIVGISVNNIISLFNTIADSETDASDIVIILDTLKKFVEILEKRKAKDFYSLLRRLTVRGATICLLGHTNKYEDGNGKLIYEGTADLRNDIDDLIYLHASLNESRNVLEVTTAPDKVRADFSPISFEIDKTPGNNLKVTQVGKVINIIPDCDREIVNAIKYAIRDGCETQRHIVEQAKERLEELGFNHGERKIIDRLKWYSSGKHAEFIAEKTGLKNAITYKLAGF